MKRIQNKIFTITAASTLALISSCVTETVTPALTKSPLSTERPSTEEPPPSVRKVTDPPIQEPVIKKTVTRSTRSTPQPEAVTDTSTFIVPDYFIPGPSSEPNVS